MMIVKSKSNATRHAPAEPPSRQRIALERVESAVVPGQDVAAKLWPASRHVRKQLVEACWSVRWRATRIEIDAGRDIPAETEHGLSRVEQRLPHQSKVFRRVLDAIKGRRVVDAPAVSSRLNDHAPITRPASVVGTRS